MGNSAVSNIQQNISAYETAPALNNTVTAGEAPRPVYPEDSYVQFVVTTKVQSETATSADAELGGEL
jgi:type IV pilus assembly protein PilN